MTCPTTNEGREELFEEKCLVGERKEGRLARGA